MKEKKSRIKSFLVTASILGAVTYSSALGAEIPLANYNIGNQATLTYQTLGGTDKLLQSNTVLTKIKQTYGVGFAPNRITTVTAGNNAIFNHTLTNYGNGIDDFDLDFVGYGSRDVKVFLDANNNSVIDPGETEIIPENGLYKILGLNPWESVSVIVRVSTTSGETTDVTADVIATSLGSYFNPDVPVEEVTITETIKFTTKANVEVYKALDTASGVSDIDREVTVYLKLYNDSIDTDGADAILTDTLNTKFTYIENSAKWQAFGSATPVAITDNYNQNGIVYTVNKKNPDGTGNDVVNFTVTQVPKDTLINSTGGILSFKVSVKAGTLVGGITNTADFQFKSGTEPTVITGTSNTVTYSVLKYVSATFTGDTIANAQAGQELRFVNTFKNTANASETYNLTIADKFFPIGTTFRLALQTPGQSERPIYDNNGDGVIDTGVVAVNETLYVILYAQLPQNITNLSSNYTVKNVATSIYTPAYNVNALDTLTTLSVATVDLTNNQDLSANPDAPGKGIGPELSPVTQISLNPGQEGNFVLYINNTSSYITDSFKLEVSTKADFSDQILPQGVTVKFKTGGGAEVTSTSSILPNASQRINAEVNVTANTISQTVPLYFRVSSLTTGATDIKYDSLTINSVRNISITPNRTGSIYAGGKIVYTHIVKNNGNVVEGNGVVSDITIGVAESLAQWGTEIFLDTNGNGAFDAGVDTPFVDFATINGLTPGQQVTIFARVAAPIGASAASSNVTTITPNVTLGTYSSPATVTAAVDTTTVLAEALTIVKTQKLTSGGSYTTNLQSADPDSVIYYRVRVTNTGPYPVNNVQIKDTIPQFTVMNSAGSGTYYNVTNASGVTGANITAQTQPSNGSRGDIIANVGTLGTNEIATLYFQVKIIPVPNN